jgi:tetratricopeptide (TPR) repeat protein
MRIGRDIRNWICGVLIGIAAICFVSAAAADDGEVCVRGSGSTAIDACTRALSSSDRRNLAIIYSNRGNQRERMGEYEKAIADHNEAIRTDPTYAAGFMHRGNAYARHGEFDRAIADHSEAIRLGPKDADAFYNRGYTYSSKGDHERAVADTQKESNWTPTNHAFGVNAAGRALLSANNCKRRLMTAIRPIV